MEREQYSEQTDSNLFAKANGLLIEHGAFEDIWDGEDGSRLYISSDKPEGGFITLRTYKVQTHDESFLRSVVAQGDVPLVLVDDYGSEESQIWCTIPPSGKVILTSAPRRSLLDKMLHRKIDIQPELLAKGLLSTIESTHTSSV